MQNLIQIIYVSRATFPSTPGMRGLEPHVARILAKSRANNRHAGLTGVLYFGDGCFFQCLEGDTAAVDLLWAKLEQDGRHTDLTLVSRKPITQNSFADWSMKYVLVEKEIERLLQERGYTSFNPYLFDTEMTQALLDVLKVTRKSDVPNEPAYQENKS